MNKEKRNKLVNHWSNILGTVGGWFLSAAFILWGWSVIAPHLNCPSFSYWEILAMRMALGSITAMFRTKKD